MYQYKGLEDTIAAIATPAGQGGIGIVRISGKDALAVADSILHFDGSKVLINCQSHTVHHGWVVHAENQEILDEVLVILMRAPQTYTTEDIVEIHCHGGMTVVRAVLDAVLSAGARLALPGEFTKRAFLHGRMDLSQAEAVLDIIHAKTETFLRQSQFQLKGDLSARLHHAREELIKIYTLLEALINFPEDDIDAENLRQIADSIRNQENQVAVLLKSSASGRILKEGFRIVLCGKPNVGKSSLLNALLKEQRAIVTAIAGTTRDVLEESAQFKGIPVSLIDTAGILDPRDLIEEEAVKRSHLFIKSADLVLLVLDHSRLLEDQDRKLIEQLRALRVLVVVNKIDLKGQMDAQYPKEIFGADQMVQISAFEPAAVQELENKIIDMIHGGKDLDTHGLLISNIRHIRALEETQKNLKAALLLMGQKASLEFVSEEIKGAVNQLDAITGRNIDEDLLESIFSAFCIGK